MSTDAHTCKYNHRCSYTYAIIYTHTHTSYDLKDSMSLWIHGGHCTYPFATWTCSNYRSFSESLVVAWLMHVHTALENTAKLKAPHVEAGTDKLPQLEARFELHLYSKAVSFDSSIHIYKYMYLCGHVQICAKLIHTSSFICHVLLHSRHACVRVTPQWPRFW